MGQIRIEKDSLGQRELPADALYGINTLRALENFPLTGRTIATLPEFVTAMAIVKEAAAHANRQIGALSADRAEAIIKACKEIRAGKHNPQLLGDLLGGPPARSRKRPVHRGCAIQCS